MSFMRPSLLPAIRERDASAEAAPYPPSSGWPDSAKVAAADRRALLGLVDRLGRALRHDHTEAGRSSDCPTCDLLAEADA